VTRQIVLDTETTGLNAKLGDRVIEIGCVEVLNRRITDRSFHTYVNPEREIEEGAAKVHGIDREYLADKPKFAAIAAEFIEFIGGSELVIHNAEFDVDFLDRERIGRAQAAVFAMKEDAKNHYAATLARVHGVRFTIAVVHDTISTEVYELSGVDVTINPRAVTAEEIVRFAHDPRTQQVAMLEGNRYEVLDITTQPTSEYVGLRFRDMPIRGALIGAIVRDGKAVFPRSDEVLEAGDRVIVFTERARVGDVEKVL